MIAFVKAYKSIFIILFFLSICIIYVIYTVLKPVKKLPVFSPYQVNPELVDSTIQHKIKYHKIGAFKLINQNGDTITEKTYENKIYVADFFFTTCKSICPIMTDHMYDIQKKIMHDDEVMLLSHTVMPKIDTVAQLKRYAKQKGVIDTKWHLVTGDKKHIYNLARKHYLAVKTVGNGGEFDMIHTENFLLVDKEKRIRGFYDGTKLEAIEELLEDIFTLKKEYQPKPSFIKRLFTLD